MLYKFGNYILINFYPYLIVCIIKITQILPASCRNKLHTVYICLNFIKIVWPEFKIIYYRSVYMTVYRIFFPYIKIRFNVYFSYSVKSYHVKFSYRFIIFCRISRRYYYPSLRYLLISECFALQKLKHCRCKRFRHTIYLIDKQNSLRNAAFLNFSIYTCNNFTHCIFCDRIFFSVKFFLNNKRQTNCTLPCMMCNRIRDKSYFTLSRNLFHNLCLANTRRSYK